MISASQMPDPMAKVTITTFVEEEIKEGLKALADAERRSMSQMAAIVIEQAIEKAIKDGVIEAPKQPGSMK